MGEMIDARKELTKAIFIYSGFQSSRQTDAEADILHDAD